MDMINIEDLFGERDPLAHIPEEHREMVRKARQYELDKIERQRGEVTQIPVYMTRTLFSYADDVVLENDSIVTTPPVREQLVLRVIPAASDGNDPLYIITQAAAYGDEEKFVGLGEKGTWITCDLTAAVEHYNALYHELERLHHANKAAGGES
jgi:hypothetical protein